MSYKKNFKVGFYGMSHLGLVYSAAAICKGIDVLCFDDDKKLIKKLSDNIFSIYEPGLKNIFKNKKNIFCSDLKKIKNCKIVFYSLDAPTNNKNKTNLIKIKKKIIKLLNILAPKTFFILLTQVEPGFTRHLPWPNNRKFYQVETLVFGKAIKRAINPERIIIGSDKSTKNLIISNFYKNFTNNIVNTNYETAELIKISINLILISSLTMANAISEFKFKQTIIKKDLLNALRLDKRIGKKAYILPGLGISGGNLERDLEAAINLSSQTDNKFLIKSFFQTIKKISNYRKNWILRNLSSIKKIKNVCLLGLSYKENTSSTKNSVALDLVQKLKNINFRGYDPKAKLSNKYKNLKRFNNPYEACKNSDIMIISTPWKEFENLKILKIKKLLNKKIILDPFGRINSKLKKIKIISL